MGLSVDFTGTNVALHAAEGDEEFVSTMHAFRNGVHVVSAWQFTMEEIEQINRTGTVYVSIWSGNSTPPIFVGSEDSVRQLIADVGVWRK